MNEIETSNSTTGLEGAITPQEAEDINAGIARAWGLAGALRFLAQAEYGSWSDIEKSTFMDSLEEMAGAIREGLSPAMDAADKLNAIAWGAWTPAEAAQ